MPYHDADDADMDDQDYPDLEVGGNGHVAMEPCPNCRRAIYEEAERCPYCGHYVTAEEDGRRQPWWIVVGVIICLIVALGWIMQR